MPRLVDFFIIDRQWDVNKLSEFFILGDVDAIKNIPLSYSQREDSLFWFCEENGAYSIRSGYKLVTTLAADDSTSCFSFLAVWKKNIWCLNVSNCAKRCNGWTLVPKVS